MHIPGAATWQKHTHLTWAAQRNHPLQKPLQPTSLVNLHGFHKSEEDTITIIFVTYLATEQQSSTCTPGLWSACRQWGPPEERKPGVGKSSRNTRDPASLAELAKLIHRRCKCSHCQAAHKHLLKPCHVSCPRGTLGEYLHTPRPASQPPPTESQLLRERAAPPLAKTTRTSPVQNLQHFKQDGFVSCSTSVSISSIWRARSSRAPFSLSATHTQTTDRSTRLLLSFVSQQAVNCNHAAQHPLESTVCSEYYNQEDVRSFFAEPFLELIHLELKKVRLVLEFLKLSTTTKR